MKGSRWHCRQANVGKSSLFNRLVERERAIVTATPGTTRDLVTETVALGGIPIKLIDTAGIRHSTDEAESIGIRKSYEALSEADLVLVVSIARRNFLAEDRELLDVSAKRRALAIANKSDLAADGLPAGRHESVPYLGCDGRRDRRTSRGDPG